MMRSFPFTPIDKPLKVALGQRYIVPAARWIMRGDGNTVLATLGNSSWEAAFSVIYLLDTKQLLEAEDWIAFIDGCDELIAQLDRMIKATVQWLLDRAEIESDETNAGTTKANWDGLPWDTSVVLRCFLAALDYYGPEKLDCFEQLERIISISLPWLIDSFSEWLALTYTVGPQDVAEILILVTNLAESSPDLYQKIVGSSSWHGREEELAWEIAEFLLKTRTEAREFPIVVGEQEQTFALWWGEYFGTAEVLEGLCEFYRLQLMRTTTLSSRKKLVFEAIEEALYKAILHFNYTQKDGAWGSAVTDTARVAITYMRLSSVLPTMKPNAFVIFKSLRWLCADSQVLKDGSFLHSLFLTIYYAMSMMAFFKYWDLANASVLEVYDMALLDAQPSFPP